MENWTEKSIKRANEKGYLDDLQSIYPIQINPLRKMDPKNIPIIRKLHGEKEPVELIKKLFDLDRFPIDDPYLSCLRLSDEIFENNPKTVSRIGSRLLELDFDSLIALCEQPKSATRQMGHVFKHWLHNLGYPFFMENEFDEHTGVCFLEGSDKKLSEYVNRNLGANLEKGIDLVLKIGSNQYVVGEAKFITDSGGTQTNQLDVALALTNRKIKHATTIAIVDGIVWFNPSYLEKVKKNGNGLAMSALLLKEFIASQKKHPRANE